jgi:hypothetical protein
VVESLVAADPSRKQPAAHDPQADRGDSLALAGWWWPTFRPKPEQRNIRAIDTCNHNFRFLAVGLRVYRQSKNDSDVGPMLVHANKFPTQHNSVAFS